MVESSKILTVSYGTFSCTLEGFDDSFSTMKAIAEYFRDLAAGDRYFGAEPPTPDAEMLTRIAEREISRRVEMRSSTTGIVLRASDPAPAVAAPQGSERVTFPQTRKQAPQQQAEVEVEEQAEPQVQDLLRPANAAAVAEADMSDAADNDASDDADIASVLDAAPVMPPAPRPPVNGPSMAQAANRARDVVQDPDRADDNQDTRMAPAVQKQPDMTGNGPSDDTPPYRATVPAHPDADSVAAKLQRIRAVVGGVPLTTPTTYAEDLDVTTEASDETMDLDLHADAEPPTAPISSVKAPETVENSQDQTDTSASVVVASDTERSDAELDSAIARAMAVFGGQDSPDTDTQTDTDTDTDADTGEADGEAQGATQSDDDLTATTLDDAAPSPAGPAADAASSQAPDQDASVAAPADAEADETAATAPTDETDDQISAVLRNLERAGLRQTQKEQAPTETTAARQTDSAVPAPAPVAAATEEPAPVAPPAAPRGRILRITRRPRDPDVQPAAEAPVTTADTDDTVTAIPATAATDEAIPEAPNPSSEASAHADDAKTAVADDFADSVAARDGAGDMIDFDPEAVESTLSEDDEADLQRELASLVAEQDAEQAPQPAPAEATDTPAPLAPAADEHSKPRRDPLPDTSEAEMSRIMSQADDELADPNASRRRNAIAHLKAAVAATEAARQLGEAGTDRTATEEVFRDDLQKVVQPRRAPRPEAAPDRSERPRPGPLKLVASQRIDLGDTAPAESVQPRRIATPAAEAPASDTGNFAEFAEQMGATSLQDLLEAAAAYTAFVEGSEDFSRPHIMQKVKQTVAEDFSREDGLRSFGTLLRQGRIERVRNGRFAVSHRTRFKPDAMAAGG